MKIVLYLMNKKGATTLQGICDQGLANSIKAVISATDKNVENDFFDRIKETCNKYKIRFIERSEDNGEFKSETRIVIGWRWIIPSTKNLIIFHDSILPRYRGFAPLVNSLINGERTVGVSAIFASSNFDQGDIIAQASLDVCYPLKISAAIDLIAPLYASLAIEIINKLVKNQKLTASPQNEKHATYSIWRSHDDYTINWEQTAEEIERFVNAVGSPYQGAKSYIEGSEVKILSVELLPDIELELRHVGKVLFIQEGFPVIITKDGLLKILELTNTKGESMLPLKKLRTQFK